MSFTEPEVLASFDRSWGDKKEELRLERGEYQGKPTFALRVSWQAGDGVWRWAQSKPNQNGKCWQSLNLKARELEELGRALIEAAHSKPSAPPRARGPARVEFTAPETDDIPF